LKALSNPNLPKKFQKIHLQIGITAVCPNPQNSIYGSHGLLGVNAHGKNNYQEFRRQANFHRISIFG
jgi:hypothetical protein